MKDTKETFKTIATATNPFVWLLGIPFVFGIFLGVTAHNSVKDTVKVIKRL